MGLFKKKPDPISERARALNEEIAALEVQIKKLSAEQTQPAVTPNHQPQSAPQPAPQLSPQPRLRSTAMPHYRQAAAMPVAPPPPNPEPVFEEVDQERLQSQPRTPPAPDHELDVRKSDLTAFWRRLKNHFRGPPTSNPKLVNYLAAGSIQGLRPLRYERRVARNRFIVLVICLVLVLWGLIAIFMKHK